MSYSTDKIYQQVGRADGVAVLTLYDDSDEAKTYGNSVTVMFVYSANEREKYENKFLKKIDENTTAVLKVRSLGNKISKELTQKLEQTGINTASIRSIFGGFSGPHDNYYFEEKTRSIPIHKIPIRTLPKGGDNDWIYGLKKRFIADGIGLSPYDRERYLAMKKFYEENELSQEEMEEINENGQIKPSVELKYLEIKFDKEVISEVEKERFSVLFKQHLAENFAILKKELDDAGLNLVDLRLNNRDVFSHLTMGTMKFSPWTLSVGGKRAIYLDWKGYLHILLRHLKEFQISPNYSGKDKIPWNPNDLNTLMGKVIECINEDAQKYWLGKPNNRYSRYGDQSAYYQGDYYTIHIEASGRISTLHRNEKRIE